MKLKRIAIEVFDFINHIFENKYLLFELVKRDFRQKYVTNIFGLAWAIIDPLAMMVIFWFIFEMGLRTSKNMEVPFIVYLITGLISYTFFQQTLSQSTNVIKSYSFLLKKVNFRVSILPLVRILSELVMHFITITIAIIIILSRGIFPSFYWIQVLYFVFATSMLLLGLSWMTSSINLFFPDIHNIIQIVLRLLFYATPIFWTEKTFPIKIITILRLNPMYYIVLGYRDSLLFGIPFWHHWALGIYFWCITLFSLLAGIFVFSRLRPHFADVA